MFPAKLLEQLKNKQGKSMLNDCFCYFAENYGPVFNTTGTSFFLLQQRRFILPYFFLSLRIFWSRTARKNHQKIKTLQNFSCYSEKKKIRKKGEKRETN